MLIIWRPPGHLDDTEQPADDPTTLDSVLDQIHKQALADNQPHAVVIYAGNRYPHGGHHSDGRYHPDDPGDGSQPELTLTLGADDSPVYWATPGQPEQVSKGPRHVPQPEPPYFFEYLFGGQESYATESSLVPHTQAREAARRFIASGGQRPDNITWHTG